MTVGQMAIVTPSKQMQSSPLQFLCLKADLWIRGNEKHFVCKNLLRKKNNRMVSQLSSLQRKKKRSQLPRSAVKSIASSGSWGIGMVRLPLLDSRLCDNFGLSVMQPASVIRARASRLVEVKFNLVDIFNLASSPRQGFE